METVDKVVDIDNNFMDPQFCATIACDIYKHLRVSEVQHSFPYCIEWAIFFPITSVPWLLLIEVHFSFLTSFFCDLLNFVGF